MSGIRERMVELASFYGRNGGTNVKDHREGFLDLVGPHESPEMRRAMLDMSSCALFVRGLWRELGLRHHLLLEPYRIGQAMADVQQIARELGALVEVTDSARVPKPGDSPIVWDKPDGTDAHVLVVCWVDEIPGMLRIGSVDGGQRTAAGVRAITERKRTWAKKPDGWLDMPGGSPKRVRRWVDLEKLFAAA